MFRSTYRQVLARRDGIEVSIPNIIVAIVVSLVVIAAVVAGVVFVIPFSQNASAQGDAQTVQSAEQIYYAQATPSDTYGNGYQLVVNRAILKNTKHVSIAVPDDGSTYCVASLSATGDIYYVTNDSTDVGKIAAGQADTALTDAGCRGRAQVTAATDLDGKTPAP